MRGLEVPGLRAWGVGFGASRVGREEGFGALVVWELRV